MLDLRPGEKTPRITSFWSLTEVARTGAADPLDFLDDAATDMLESCLADAMKRRMVADVPLGTILSGGIDNSTVTALMQASSDRPVRTFSIGFDEAGYDEAAHAEAVTRHLGTDHITLVVTPDQALEKVPRLSAVWDEPFADASQIPTLLLPELTRRHVTVALSGDGGMSCSPATRATASPPDFGHSCPACRSSCARGEAERYGCSLIFERRDGIGKWLLRRVLRRHVPPTLVERPKQGIRIPLDAWLRGRLRDWAESLLASNCLSGSGLIDAASVRRTWTEHLSCRHNHQYRLWAVLMFEAWRRDGTNAN